VTFPIHSLSWKSVAGSSRRLLGRHALPHTKGNSRDLENTQPAGIFDGAGAHAEASCRTAQLVHILARQAEPQRRRTALHQDGRSGPLQHRRSPGVDERQAAPVDQRVLNPEEKESGMQSPLLLLRTNTCLTLYIIIHRCISVYRQIRTQYTSTCELY